MILYVNKRANILFNMFKGSACSLEIYTHILASMGYWYHNFWKNMGTLCFYHSWSDVHEDGIRIQYTGSMHLLAQKIYVFILSI